LSGVRSAAARKRAIVDTFSRQPAGIFVVGIPNSESAGLRGSLGWLGSRGVRHLRVAKGERVRLPDELADAAFFHGAIHGAASRNGCPDVGAISTGAVLGNVEVSCELALSVICSVIPTQCGYSCLGLKEYDKGGAELHVECLRGCRGEQ